MNVDNKKTEISANNIVLHVTLIANIGIFLFSIYQAGLLISQTTQVSLVDAMWMNATQGGSAYSTIGIVICLAIILLHHLNNYIDQKSKLFGSIIRIILKFPVNIILLLLAVWIGAIGYGKYSAGMGNSNILGAGYLTDAISVAALLFLTFFVRKT